MIKLRSKITISLIVVLAMIVTQLTVFATNEKIELVKNSTNEYIIYVKDMLKNDFKFAFSNDPQDEESNLVFQNAALDSTNADANKIAYINDVMLPMFSSKTYMWVKSDSDGYIITVDVTKTNTT